MEILKSDTDYAMRLLVHLAVNGAGTTIAAKAMADAQDIPPDFVYKILQRLAGAGIVSRRMGAHGGFKLALDPGQITLSRVAEAIQGPVMVRKCALGLPACGRQDSCPISAKLKQVQDKLTAFLEGVTLADILAESRIPGIQIQLGEVGYSSNKTP